MRSSLETKGTGQGIKSTILSLAAASEAHGMNPGVTPEAMHDLHAFADQMVLDLPPEGEVELPDWKRVWFALNS